ncbi:MAG: redoxin domain-containing protein [Bacteroidetes bacterium]|nr:redoxin domain-containing protein [Bacteroidota bacterium]
MVLYFYPQDNTATCKVPCRDNHALLTERGFVVLGVSADSERPTRNSLQKFDLPLRHLLADTEHEISKIQCLGREDHLWQDLRGFTGRLLIIDEKGKSLVIHPVESGRHAEQVLELYA